MAAGLAGPAWVNTPSGWQADGVEQPSWALRLDQVTRRFSGRRVLGPVNLGVEAGAVCLVTGDNGSGKTTLLRIAAGLLTPSSGRRQAAGRCLYLDARSGARFMESSRNALDFLASIRRHPAAGTDRVLADVELGELADARAATLSSGQRARLAIAVALVAEPDLVCLDEPTAPLDPAGRSVIGRAVTRLRSRGCAVIVAAHETGALDGGQDVILRLQGGRLGGVRW